ncbi:hypothetical protein CAPTEDRAFT_213464 [Capitella teleta]|uniref:Farnesoic acid O-methyl transferase domain-containing protein n=1 Tax=Capitella teleta TaxID=283909 RepID=R7T9G8_CAPTE|nr:hypothetical protein CAPTEDRAFT_213464 [Capitella teleta]|eukprot:ELT90167.1 hypothetical protein CAPTEDRAFT_213464 [Capitella teleta]
MTTCLILTLVLLTDLAMGEDVRMCFMGKLEPMSQEVFVNNYPEAGHIYFGIKSCTSAGIGLVFKNVPFFVIFDFVDGKRAQISKTNSTGEIIKLWASPAKFLDCNTMKYFWLKWVDRELSLGHGLQVGMGTLATVADSEVSSKYDSVDYFWNGEDPPYPEFQHQCRLNQACGILVVENLGGRRLKCFTSKYCYYPHLKIYYQPLHWKAPNFHKLSFKLLYNVSQPCMHCESVLLHMRGICKPIQATKIFT